MWSFARKILMHDKVKFAVAAAGVSMSVMLVLVQIGLYLGFMENASNLIDHSTADVWVTGEGNENFDFAAPMDERVYYRIASTPGVDRAERVVLAFGQFRLASGGNQGVEVVGLERDAELLSPWNVVGGDVRRIHEVDGIAVDRSELPKLGLDGADGGASPGLGARNEITGFRSRIVAMTSGIRSFTTSPFVFTNLETARAYTRTRDDRITYVLVRRAPGTSVDALVARLDRIPGVEAHARPSFSTRTRDYWSSRTGVGTGFFMTAVMGVIVGLVVVGQILYSGTLEHLKEYGTLKAMGAKAGAIVRVILYQALISALVGYVIGGGLSFLVREGVRAAALNVVLSPNLLASTAVLTAVMCSAAAILSIVKVLRLDPASVFKG
ncbi:MAG: FtsX-like permease family protein [Deltaproteobacteria bacterium]|nr:FtsX-like permease family protein [Deltaproteobacteria bacterium]